MSLDCHQYIEIPSKIKFENQSTLHALFSKHTLPKEKFFKNIFILYKFVEFWVFFHKGFMYFVYLLLDLFSFLMFKTKYCDNLR